MRLSTRKWPALTFAVAVSAAASAHPCMFGRMIHRVLLSGQDANMVLDCRRGESVELTLVAGHAVDSLWSLTMLALPSSDGSEPSATSIAVGLDAHGFQRLSGTRVAAGDGSEAIYVRLDTVEAADLLERMQRAHVARVRFDPAGPAGEALATLEIPEPSVLEGFASRCF